MRKDFALSPSQKVDARIAIQLLEGSGITLEEAARRALGNRKAKKQVTVVDLADSFLRVKLGDGSRPSTVAWYMVRLNKFSNRFGGVMVDAISRAEFRAWVQGLEMEPATAAAQVRAVRALFNWAANQEPPMAGDDITEGMKTSESRVGADIAFLSIEDCERIMHGAGPYQSATALMLFAGVRPDEMAGDSKPPLLWKHVNTREKIIRIPGEISKTSTPRLLENLPENLWSWLKPGKDDERICANNSRQPVRRAQVSAKFGKKRKWPHDALRHSFATYHVAAFNNPSLTSLLMGHQGNPTMLHRHYRGLTTKFEAEQFWKILPKVTSGTESARGSS